MEVSIDKHPELASEGNMVLNLFDRRFVTEFRRVWNVDVWTPEAENKFHQFVNDSRSSKFLADIQRDKDNMSSFDMKMSAGQSEAWMNQHSLISTIQKSKHTTL
jgi:hypothetical protein